MRSLADGFFGKMLRYDKLPKLSSFFAVPVKAPEVTEGAFAFRDDHKAILYWKASTKYPPLPRQKESSDIRGSITCSIFIIEGMKLLLYQSMCDR